MSNQLAAIGSTSTVSARAVADGSGRTVFLDTSIATGNVAGLSDALALKANVANPGFAGTADFVGCATVTGLTRPDGSIKDAGLANALSNQLGFYAPRAGPAFSGVASFSGLISAQASPQDGGWASYQVQAAPSSGAAA